MKNMFVIYIAIIATLIPIIFQYYTRDREVNPGTRRLMWVLMGLGVVVLVVGIILRIVV